MWHRIQMRICKFYKVSAGKPQKLNLSLLLCQLRTDHQKLEKSFLNTEPWGVRHDPGGRGGGPQLWADIAFLGGGIQMILMIAGAYSYTDTLKNYLISVLRWEALQMSHPRVWQGLYSTLKPATAPKEPRVTDRTAEKSTFSLQHLWERICNGELLENTHGKGKSSEACRSRIFRIVQKGKKMPTLETGKHFKNYKDKKNQYG